MSRSLLFACFWVLASLGIALLGPFGTYEILPFWPRLAYWTLIVFLSCGFDAALRRTVVVSSLWGRILRRLFFVLVFSVCLFIINASIFDTWYGLNDYLRAFSFVLIISLGIEVLIGSIRAIRLYNAQQSDPETHLEAHNSALLPALKPLMDKIPEAKHGPVWHLEAKGHYLQVLTANGCEQVLMRFSDAIAGLPDALGVQTHRSHWVALDAVQRLVRVEGRDFVRLTNENLVPVSKKRLKDVEFVLKQL